jgi:hypothetical protein
MPRYRMDMPGATYMVAGSFFAEGPGDGGPATMAEVDPYDVAPLPDCGYLIADGYAARVRRVLPDGTITTVAGTGRPGFGGDGGPAPAAALDYPRGIAAYPDGSFLVADEYNRRVRRVAPDGTITTVAGNGTPGFSGDGGPATRAELGLPVAVAVLRDGSFVIADALNERVRRVAPDGTISTVAGIGSPGSSGDGGPATLAQIGYPVGVAATRDGGFLITDQYGEQVRRVAPDGTISTVAGTGRRGASGDGGPATRARLDYPRGVAEAPDGGVLIGDQGNERVRRVWPDGRISTIAMTGMPNAFMFGGPRAVAVTRDGGVLIATAGGVEFINAHLGGSSSRECHRLLIRLMRPHAVHAGAMTRAMFTTTLTARAQLIVRLMHQSGELGGAVSMRMMMRARMGHDAIAFRAPSRPGRYLLELRVRSMTGKRAVAMTTLMVGR